MQRLTTKIYKNEFAETFRGDESGKNYPRETPGVFYSKAIPTPVKSPKLLAWSDDLAGELEVLKPVGKDEVEVLAGNRVLPSMRPYAACYGGHQFGHWAGQLGDGRAITLGEWENSSGKIWEMQLKGAGPTAYSRRADGRAVLRSSLREYLMSEAMYYLGVSTTRALSLVSTGEKVLRDMFYDGNAAYEPGAIVMRVSPSFLRFGNYEIFAARQELDHLQKLVEWTISRFYPHIQLLGEEKILQWFKEVTERTALLMVEWMRVGFVHGVMNTDNMSILGLTIDYGPYSFMDDFDPRFTPNTTDLPGRRYAFGKQASVAQWNLGCLASAIAPLLSGTKELIQVIETYQELFFRGFYQMMGNKLGLDEVKQEDILLIVDFDKMMAEVHPDMTIFYQLLTDMPLEFRNEEELVSHFEKSFYNPLQSGQKEVLVRMITSYMKRIKLNTCSRDESESLMRKANPRFILRNYLLHQAIEDLEKGDDQLFVRLQEAIKEPYSVHYDEFFVKRPHWAGKKAGCSMLSCSS